MGIDINERDVEQQTVDAEISVTLEVEKNDNIEIIEKEEKEDGKETRSDNVIENEEQEDVIDINERGVEQQTVDAEISVTLEVEKKDKIEIIEKEEKEDGKEARSGNVIENKEQEDVIDINER